MIRQNLVAALAGIVLLAMSPAIIWASSEKKSSTPDRECGAKCLYVVLRGYAKGPSTYKEIRKELGEPTPAGYTLLQLRDLARKQGLYAEAVEANKLQLQNWSSSCSVILHLNKLKGKPAEHYVICEGVTPNSATIFDASSGVPSQISHEIFTLWSGKALVVSQQPIDLTAAAAGSGWWYAILGATMVVLGGLAVWAVHRAKRRHAWLAVYLLAVSSLASGCSEPANKSTPSPSAPAAQADNQALPPKATGLWVDKPSVQAGPFHRAQAQQLVPVRVHNTEREPVTIVDSRFTCGCLYAKFSSFTIEPESSIVCDLMLDCRDVGERRATAILLTNKNEQISIDAVWTVTASLSAEPDTLSGIELKAGESREVAIRLKQLEPVDLSRCSVRFARTKEADTRFLDVDAKIVDEQIIATFHMLDTAPSGLVRGFLDVTLPDQTETELRVPFTLYVAADFDVSPKKVFFTRKGGKFHSQILVSTEPTNQLDPVEVRWLGSEPKPCEFKWSFADGEGVIDVAVEPETTAGITEIEITAVGGKFKKTLPVVFPQ